MKESIQKLLKGIEKVEMFLSKAFLSVMILVVALQVFFRYVINKPLTWPEELSSFLLIWLTFLVADILLKRKGHVQVDFFTNKMSEKGQEIVSIIVNLYILAFLVFLIISSIKIEFLQIHHPVGAAMKIPKAFYTMAATISCTSMFLSICYFQWESVEKLIKLSKKKD